ncbi:DsrS [hydrothermal vent metagenome]|uniref:DsrS n=1 Tax=hydrothermal vent metagenome TaxID=652676 RepID=A0A1W1D9A2_9ZZZZ
MLEPEDILKLNVLIATSVAIRIDTYKLTVVGLNAQFKEQIIALKPSGDSEVYIKEVKKLLVTQVLGAMGGYPSYLKRWSRMGQVESSNLTSLLKLGEVEAVVAVSNSTNLDNDLLKLTWWCATNTDNQAEIGRFLLTKPFVLNTQTGREIAQYLLEFLPFVDDIEQLIDTTSLVLQEGLIEQKDKDRLWKQGQRKTAFLVGFVERMRGNLPNEFNLKIPNYEHSDLQIINNQQSQLFLTTLDHILKKINQEYVLYRALEVLGQYMSHQDISTQNTIEKITNQVSDLSLTADNEQDKLDARLLLAGVSEKLVVSTISAHNLTGSAIRKKLAHVLEPIQQALKTLTTP